MSISRKACGEYCPCCQECPLYLNTCIPVVIGGYVVVEYDFDFCSYCPGYWDCENLWGKMVLNYDVVDLGLLNADYAKYEACCSRGTNDTYQITISYLVPLNQAERHYKGVFLFLVGTALGLIGLEADGLYADVGNNLYTKPLEINRIKKGYCGNKIYSSITFTFYFVYV